MAMMNEMEYRTIGSALAGGYRAAVYCRLSKDDDLQGESASIANQRDMLEKYCEKQGWEVVAVYQDDGFTGLNMERPDLQRMLRAIERRQINLVITKDLSRLGRNYLQTGHLIEDFFPRNGVRYIAMNDGIDTLRDNNDIAPFKNILNEMYSKDISKKVHSSYLLKAQKGQFTGCLAPFGYRKDPEDKNHLLIDEETAPIVRLIFGYALNGHGPNYIRRRLEEEKIPCPTWWNRERGLRNTRTKWEKKDPENGRYMWDFSVIKDLLMNPVYTGAIASQKKDYRFKIGTIGEKKPEDWVVVEGQHEPLIDRMSFDIVQNKLKSRQRPGQTNEISLFAGLLKCGECGKSLTVRYTNAKHPQQISSALLRMLFILLTHSSDCAFFKLSVMPSWAAICTISLSSILIVLSFASARCLLSVPFRMSRSYSPGCSASRYFMCILPHFPMGRESLSPIAKSGYSMPSSPRV